jgi:hypothetical protein
MAVNREFVTFDQGSLKGRIAVVKIDHRAAEQTRIMYPMRISEKQALTVRCPTCGAKPGEKCELGTGQPRTEPHRDRRLAASEA